ncbi:SEL1 [Musa troglodytarum]|uniref:SEL1 n=1 Tax=Musa troglodytarum TaxID=320322 RepID=A0A9E7GTJ5_9LILI|nr:SEL1 [Musa troglodytarum]
MSERGIHSRNKQAMELVAKGWSALQEVDRVIDYADRNDQRLIPLLRGAKENFELALEIDNMNTHARYWLGRMHLKYHVPGACKAIGAALLVEAANMGDPDAQYELGCRLRVEVRLLLAQNDYVQSDQQAFYYIEKAVDQGHAGAAIAYGSLLLQGYEVPEVITRFNSNRSPSTGALRKKGKKVRQDPLVLAKEQFQIAADAGCELGLRWLKRISDDEKFQQQTTQ